MRNSTKKQLIEMADTMQEAISYLVSSPTDKDDIYELITTSVRAINDALQPYNEDILLRGDCLLEELSKVLNNGGVKQKRLWKSFNDYRGTIYSVKVKLKVLFLSCYESTWDSLESVYEEFAADPDFIVDVIIVPVARNVVGGVELVYEDYLTPYGIPNTKYTEYDIAADKPDVVFYNNPYNDTLPKSYNTDYLKVHAGLLVYIPYFLYNHQYNTPEEKKKVVLSYAGLRSHDDCDIFITQSETYINTIGADSNNADKMVALGNPKADRLLRAKESGEWPRYKEWEDKIDGKTVFMLNTHFSLFTAKRFFLIWEYLIFPIFKFIEENEDAALIWRPHPQYKVVGISLEENQEEQVYAHLEKARSSDRMILDETGISLSALMYCDALLSNTSSIVGEALVLDKPVFLFSNDPREGSKLFEGFKPMVESGDFKRQWDITHTINERDILLTQAIDRIGLGRDFSFMGGEADLALVRERLMTRSVLRFMRNICSKKDEYVSIRDMYRKQENFHSLNGKRIHKYVKCQIKDGVDVE